MELAPPEMFDGTSRILGCCWVGDGWSVRLTSGLTAGLNDGITVGCLPGINGRGWLDHRKNGEGWGYCDKLCDESRWMRVSEAYDLANGAVWSVLGFKWG